MGLCRGPLLPRERQFHWIEWAYEQSTKDVGAYIAAAPKEVRGTLNALRRTIREAAPVLDQHKSKLKGYVTPKGALRLPLDEPLPLTLIRKLVKAQMKRNEARQQRRTVVPPAGFEPALPA